MEKSNTQQKKNIIINYVYASLIALLVVACAVTIAMTSSAKPKNKGEIGGGDVPVASVTYVVPMKNATIQKDYSNTELQFNDTMKQWEMHKAIDFLAGEETNVYAVADGTVSNVYTNYLEGTVVEITHKNGLVSVYKSLAENPSVATGDKVSAGQVIGVAGATMSQELNTGNHLHFEMRLNGAKVDPNNYIDLGTK